MVVQDDIGPWVASYIDPGNTVSAICLQTKLADEELKRLLAIRQKFAGLVLETDMMIGRHIIRKLEDRVQA